jgi:tight adherence protein B
MNLMQLLLVGGGLMALMVLGYVLLGGKSPAKEGHRRLQGIRYRHSDNAVDKVESQLKKAIAARKPKFHKVAGTGSRSVALSVRLERTGKGWSVSQYMYTSLGIALAITAVMYLKSGAALLSLGIGVVAGVP